MNRIPTNILAIEIVLSGHASDGSSSATSPAEAVPVVVFPMLGGRRFGAIFNASPSLASGCKLSAAALPATPATFGLRPRTVSFRSVRAHA